MRITLRRCDVGVTQRALYNFKRRPGLPQPSGVRVPKVMPAEVADASLLHPLVECAALVALAEDVAALVLAAAQHVHCLLAQPDGVGLAARLRQGRCTGSIIWRNDVMNRC